MMAQCKRQRDVLQGLVHILKSEGMNPAVYFPFNSQRRQKFISVVFFSQISVEKIQSESNQRRPENKRVPIQIDLEKVYHTLKCVSAFFSSIIV